MPGRHCVERRRFAAARNLRCSRVCAAQTCAAIVADAAGQNASDAGRARVRYGAWHGALRTAGAGRARLSRGSLGIEVEGDVSGVKAVVSDLWPVVSNTTTWTRFLLTTDH